MKKKELKNRIKELKNEIVLINTIKANNWRDLVELSENPDSEKSERIRKDVKFLNLWDKGISKAVLFGDFGKDPSTYIHDKPE